MDRLSVQGTPVHHQLSGHAERDKAVRRCEAGQQVHVHGWHERRRVPRDSFDGPAFAGAHTDSQFKSMYDGGRDGALANLDGSHILLDHDIKVGGVPAREIIIANDKYLAKSRFVVTRNRLFTTLVLIDRSRELDPPTMTNMNKFLDSFRFN